ncbi:MAG TPA: dihydrofolate reductase family protein [Pseudonocardiaceae bacterium]|nr:dihydrofolate reductase family protein [Pseudonocardiaceae bacterium]
MREVKLQISMSLDGFVASDRQHPGTSVPEDDELVDWKANRLTSVGAHLMGRVTYLEMASYWPTATGRYADVMNSSPKIVFSKTLTEATWPTTRIASGELAEEIAAIKAEPGADVVAHGGAAFVAALAAGGLIDEYCLVVQPLALGRGQGLFAELPEARRLELVESRGFPCGVVVQVYRPA